MVVELLGTGGGRLSASGASGKGLFSPRSFSSDSQLVPLSITVLANVGTARDGDGPGFGGCI